MKNVLVSIFMALCIIALLSLTAVWVLSGGIDEAVNMVKGEQKGTPRVLMLHPELKWAIIETKDKEGTEKMRLYFLHAWDKSGK